MSDLTVFQFEGQEVRFVGTSENPEWVAKDVCLCLGLSDTSKALETLDVSDKDTKNIRTSNGSYQEMLTVYESGLYGLIFKSRKPEAKRFKQWVCQEVLPSIRKTGSYSISNSITVDPVEAQMKAAGLAIATTFADLPINPYLVAGIKLNAMQAIAPEIANHIEPARQYLINATANENKLITVTELGKLLNPPLSAIKTNKLLIEKGLQIKNPNKKSKKDPTYLATDKGREYSDLTLATVEGKADTAQQLRWYDCTASLL